MSIPTQAPPAVKMPSIYHRSLFHPTHGLFVCVMSNAPQFIVACFSSKTPELHIVIAPVHVMKSYLEDDVKGKVCELCEAR